MKDTVNPSREDRKILPLTKLPKLLQTHFRFLPIFIWGIPYSSRRAQPPADYAEAWRGEQCSISWIGTGGAPIWS